MTHPASSSRHGESAKPSVTVVIVTYESTDTIGPCLDGLQASYEAQLVEVVVVDNASDDGTAQCVEEAYPWVTLLRNEVNVGYGQGCNRGLERAGNEFTVFMNPDVVVDPQCLEKLVGFMQAHTRAGLAGPSIKRTAGDYQAAGGLPSPWREVCNALRIGTDIVQRKAITPGDEPFQTDWICGAIMIGRTDVLRTMGGFDARFFLYFEETDLCVRMRNHGYQVWAVGTATAQHASNASARKVRQDLGDGECLSEHYFRSRMYYMVKHHGWMAAVFSELSELAIGAARDLVDMAMRRPGRGRVRRRLRGPLLRLPERVALDEGARCSSQ